MRFAFKNLSGMQAKQISSALRSLQKASIVLSHEVREIGHGAYEIVVVPGERLHAAGLFRGVGAQDKPWTRTLLYHLGIFGISLSMGRDGTTPTSVAARAAIPAAVSPTSVRSSPRDPCAMNESGKPMESVRTWGHLSPIRPRTKAPKPFTTVPSSTVSRCE